MTLRGVVRLLYSLQFVVGHSVESGEGSAFPRRKLRCATGESRPELLHQLATMLSGALVVHLEESS